MFFLLLYNKLFSIHVYRENVKIQHVMLLITSKSTHVVYWLGILYCTITMPILAARHALSGSICMKENRVWMMVRCRLHIFQRILVSCSDRRSKEQIWAATWENRIFAHAKTKTQISFAVAKTKTQISFAVTCEADQCLRFSPLG